MVRRSNFISARAERISLKVSRCVGASLAPLGRGYMALTDLVGARFEQLELGLHHFSEQAALAQISAQGSLNRELSILWGADDHARGESLLNGLVSHIPHGRIRHAVCALHGGRFRGPLEWNAD